ncbi:hypothetical protein HPB47_024665, partial [Ixodes persulcatus]
MSQGDRAVVAGITGLCSIGAKSEITRTVRSVSMRPSNWCASALVLTCVLPYLSAVKHVRGQSTGGKKRKEYSYYNHEKLTAFLRKVSTDYPDFTRLYSVGKSVQNRDLWVLLITKEPHEETLLKPNVKYVANMHGNE